MATLLLRQSLLQGFVNRQVNLNTTLIMFHQLIIHVLLIDLRCSKNEKTLSIYSVRIRGNPNCRYIKKMFQFDMILAKYSP